MAEGLGVLGALLASPYQLVSVLVSSARAATVTELMAPFCVDAPVYVASPEVLARVAGFSVHRGVVALGARKALPHPLALASIARSLLVVEGVGDHENVGALYRNAAAFGVEGVILDPTTADPLYRRSLRVSIGHVLHVPTSRMTSWPEGLDELRETGWTLLALTPDRDAETVEAMAERLGSDRPGVRVALMVGAEGPGLSPLALASADHRVRIPMASSVDSLNVATAAAIALYRLGPHRPGVVGPTGSGQLLQG